MSLKIRFIFLNLIAISFVCLVFFILSKFRLIYETPSSSFLIYQKPLTHTSYSNTPFLFHFLFQIFFLISSPSNEPNKNHPQSHWVTREVIGSSLVIPHYFHDPQRWHEWCLFRVQVPTQTLCHRLPTRALLPSGATKNLPKCS